MKLRPYRTFICWQYSRAHAKSTPILPAIRIKPIKPCRIPSSPVKPFPPITDTIRNRPWFRTHLHEKSLGISSKAFLRVGGRVRTDDIQNHNLTL